MAVFTNFSLSETNLLDCYDIGKIISITGIEEGVDNSNFVLTTENNTPYILTIFENRLKKEDLPFFIALMGYLANKFFPCPLPVVTKNGEYLIDIKNKKAAIVNYMDGKQISEITADHCFEVGKYLANLHILTADFPHSRINDLSLNRWNNISTQVISRADELQLGLADQLDKVLSLLNGSWPKNLPSGIIHADLFPDNVFFTGNKISAIIDFYFACHDFYIYDVAITFNCWCFDESEFNQHKASALFEGYLSNRLLSEKELQAFPVIAQGAALRILLTRLYDYQYPVPGALVKVKDPLEYLMKLNFHKQHKNFEQYGLELI